MLFSYAGLTNIIIKSTANLDFADGFLYFTGK